MKRGGGATRRQLSQQAGGFRPEEFPPPLPSLQEGLQSGEGTDGDVMLSPRSPTRSLARSLASHHLAGADDPRLSLGCRWRTLLYCTPAWSWPCPALPFFFPLDCSKIPTFISTTGPAAHDTRSTSSPYAQVPAFTICPIRTHTHKKTRVRTHKPALAHALA